MRGGDEGRWAGSPDERLELREELAAVGPWRRWVAADRGMGTTVLFSRAAPDAAGADEQARGRAARASRLRHPSLTTVLAFGEDSGGRWVVEELGRARPLGDGSERAPRGEALGEALLGVLEALAYVHGNGMAHGAVATGTMVADGQSIALSGTALGASGWEHGAAADVRGWAGVVVKLLDAGAKHGPVSSAVLRAARAAMRAGEDAALEAGRLARGIRAGAERQRVAPADRTEDEQAETSGRDASMGMRALRVAGNLLLGALTTALTVGVVLGAIALGVLWFVDRLPQEVQVPNIVGLAQQEAIASLEREGLRVGNVRRVYRDDVEAGEVAQAMPEPGMTVRQGREITLVVSLGAARVRVPRLVGLQLDEAEKLAEKSGLSVTSAGRTRSRAPLGEIVRQNPAPGANVARGERVTVYVSGGPEFGMIEVETGDDEESVRVFFRTLSITVPRGDPLQRVRILEGYREPLEVTYDRLHRPGDHIEFETHGRSGKQIQVLIEGERVYRTQL